MAQIEGESFKIFICSIKVVLLLLVFCFIKQRVTSTSPTELTEEVKRREDPGRSTSLHCKKDSEFTCHIENRCIPIEWKCDFVEQCLDGEDELGCVPIWCNFNHDLCNWENHFESVVEVNVTHERASIWRRYFSWGSQEKVGNSMLFPAPAKGTKRASDGSHIITSGYQSKASSPLPPSLMIQRKLDELGAKLKPNSRFLFSPLIFGSKSQDSNNGTTIRTRTLRSAHLKAPYISQTNSMCQLRFTYAMWTGSSAHRYSNNNLAASASQAPAKLTLKLMARPIAGRNSSIEKQLVIWSKTIRDVQSDAAETTSSEPSLDWMIGVAELGHLRQIELEFWGELALVTRDENEIAQRQGEKSRRGVLIEEIDSTRKETVLAIRDASPADVAATSITKTSTQVYGSLVAFGEFNFLGCSWPQGVNRSCELEFAQLGARASDLDSTITDYNDENSKEDSPLLEGEETQVTRDNNLLECLEGQFKCSNNICVEERRLCNFVDDCMDHEKQLGQESEDEAHALCDKVPGKEDFESHDFDLSESSSSSLSKQQEVFENQSFWTLASNWPQNKITIQNSLANLPHLPRHDHTTRRAEGHYLSFEIPQADKFTPLKPSPLCVGCTSTLSPSLKERNLFWIYLDTPWMRRTINENSTQTSSKLSDCRVKFFYNIVSDRSTSSAVDSIIAQSNLATKVYLAIEHFTLVVDRRNSSRIIGSTRKLDRFTYSHLVDYESLNELSPTDAYIEYLGLDFWREINYKLTDIKNDEKFYLRIAVIVELNENWLSMKQRATINIDDLATHFGCIPIEKIENPDEFEKFRDLKRNSTVNFSLTNYVKQKQSDTLGLYYPRRRIQSDSIAIQYEPHTLIVYVFAVLSTLMGLILVIVFVIVPYVERLTISYHDQLTVGLSDIGTGPDNSNSQVNTCELTTELDWEQVSRYWRRSTLNESLMTDSVVTLIDSHYESHSQRLDSVGSFVSLGDNGNLLYDEHNTTDKKDYNTSAR